jgi:type I restriction enzyme R subunit
MSEFDFLKENPKYSSIYSICCVAENVSEPEKTAVKCRDALNGIISYVYERYGIAMPADATMLELMDGKIFSGFVGNAVLLDSLHYIRKLGINAQHGLHIKKTQSKLALDNLVFFTRYTVDKFDAPEKIKNYILPPYMSEAETRKIYIDLYLNESGWEVMPPNSTKTLSNGTSVACGTVFPSRACCEIPVEGMPNKSGIGFCDYVLYGKDGKPLAIIEAKKTSVEPLVGQEQVKVYGDCMKAVYGYVPVLYYTNGYEIYVIDGTYPARSVLAFHTLEELTYLLQKRERNAISDLTINDKITNRAYQKMAITNICERFNYMQRRGLLVMATGTGKTRVSISLVDVLLRNKWVKNILFLADRTSLVEQAFKNFKKLLPDMSYCVLSDRSLADEPNARIIFSTHQTMINYIDAEDKEYTSARFDLIIIDEAHRSIFNKYGSIFEYFDCLLVGLTATPKEEVDANTYQLFNCESGEPNFAYSLEEAVKEKYLVPYKVVPKTTKLLSHGIKYSELSEKDRQAMETLIDDMPDDDFVIPKEQLFKIFYNIDTCRRVLEDLMENGLRVDGGQKVGKTIIFAYNHRHAELIVSTFKEMYPEYGEDYCQLIDNKVKMANRRIEKFEVNDDFRIAVSVDMLDTGIDVPAVLNLVFFKPVKSKIKFIQMIGRGTRLCPGLIDGKDKAYFLIFDYCANFEYFGNKPDGEINKNGKSLSQRLFEVKLDILVELQKYEHQSNAVHKAYYDELKPQLFSKIQAIKKNSCRISVRTEMAYVDKYSDYERWAALSLLEKKEMQLHLSKLLDNDINQSKGSLAFDMKMFDIEMSVLASGNIAQASRQVERVRMASKMLLDTASSITAVINHAKTLKTLVGTEFWTNPPIDKLEQYREEIRELIQYLPVGVDPIDIDVPDETGDGNYEGGTLIDIRTYKEKVLDYLAEHSNDPTIIKIQNLEPINADDIKSLEHILWNELGTKDDYDKTTEIDNLAAFIRSIVGIEQEAVNEKFGTYLTGNILNSQQQEFVKAIIDYVRENGDIEAEDLLEKSPFNNYDIVTLFGSNVPVIMQIVNAMHSSIQAA